MKIVKKEGAKKIRIIEQNKLVLTIIIILAILLIIVISYKFYLQNKYNARNIDYSDNYYDLGEELVCEKDSDCIRQQLTCCSCEMGGESACIAKQAASKYQQQLEECADDIVCIALYNCNPNPCSCVEGKCQES